MIMQKLKLLREERANAVVEYVVILPLVFLVLIAIIVTCFMLHDRTTLEAAAKRGAIYASHCITNPNYYAILEASANQSGSLDLSENVNSFSFNGVAKNIQPYRYFSGTTKGLAPKVQDEVYNIVKKTMIPWRSSLDTFKKDDVKFKQTNKIYYQDVEVTITAKYKIAPLLQVIGLSPNYEYTVTAKMSVNDPDDFIRNTDFVIDLIVELDNGIFGGNLQKTKQKIESLAAKLVSWLNPQ